MRGRNRNVEVFNLSMLDVISGALGAFLIIILMLMRFREPNVIKENQKLRSDLATASAQLTNSQAEVGNLQQQLEAAKRSVEDANAKYADAEQRLGMALSGREIVLVVDVSASMVGPQGDLLTQVKAGIKMLVANMSEQYQIDLVAFPFGTGPGRRPYEAKWGRLMTVSEGAKRDLYGFIDDLRVGDGTPTREALDVALSSQYESAKTIVLLSDGEPNTIVAGKLQEEDISALVAHVSTLNGGRKSINTIGVGAASVYHAAPRQNAVAFLRELASRNNGFYTGL